MEKFERLYHEQVAEVRKLKADLAIQRQSLWDKFAMAALSGFTANNAIFAHNRMCGWDLANCNTKQLCQSAFGLADNMLAVREAIQKAREAVIDGIDLVDEHEIKEVPANG